MVEGHPQEQKGYLYMVLSYPDAAGKRKTKQLPTGLSVKGNKKKAEKMLMETRQTFVPECKPIQEDVLFQDFLLQWLEIAKPTIVLTTQLCFAASCERCSYEADTGMAQTQRFFTTANVYAHLDYNYKLSSADAMVNGLSGALEALSQPLRRIALLRIRQLHIRSSNHGENLRKNLSRVDKKKKACKR